MNRYHHLTPVERETMHELLLRGTSLRAIARQLQRSPSTISREIARNAAKGVYSPIRAERQLHQRRCFCCRKHRLSVSPLLKTFVELKLNSFWSPKQICGRIALEYPDDPEMRIGTCTIYRSIYRGLLHRIHSGHLRRKGRSKPRGTTEKHGSLKVTQSIEQRPAVVQERVRVGDWEGDTVSGKDHKGHLVTLVDRFSAYLLALPMSNRKAETTLTTIQKAFADIPPAARRTLTLDNGKELTKAAKWKKRFSSPLTLRSLIRPGSAV